VGLPLTSLAGASAISSSPPWAQPTAEELFVLRAWRARWSGIAQGEVAPPRANANRELRVRDGARDSFARRARGSRSRRKASLARSESIAAMSHELRTRSTRWSASHSCWRCPMTVPRRIARDRSHPNAGAAPRGVGTTRCEIARSEAGRLDLASFAGAQARPPKGPSRSCEKWRPSGTLTIASARPTA